MKFRCASNAAIKMSKSQEIIIFQIIFKKSPFLKKNTDF